MEEDMVLAAADEEEELSKVFKFVVQLWLQGLILDDTIEAAKKIRVHQGYFEAEVTCGGEADLQRHYKRCKKNPGHTGFIPAKTFKIEHLPPGYRDNLLFDYIKSEADRTCRLLVGCTSENRPKFHPVRKHLYYPFSKVRGVDFWRTGTGMVGRVEKYTEEDNKDCECNECSLPGTHAPKKIWGKIIITTAMHVVFDDVEARRTACHFGYDTSTTLLFQCLKLTGLGVEESDIEGDWCNLAYVTHDMDIVNKLGNLLDNRGDKWDKLRETFVPKELYRQGVLHASCPTDFSPEPVVVISHPHGCSKQISVGMWTERQTWGKPGKHKEEGMESTLVNTSYTYNTPTCPGSSGALVILLPEKGKWWRWLGHVHSEGGKGNTNNNKSVAVPEFLTPPSPCQDL